MGDDAGQFADLQTRNGFRCLRPAAHAVDTGLRWVCSGRRPLRHGSGRVAVDWTCSIDCSMSRGVAPALVWSNIPWRLQMRPRCGGHTSHKLLVII